MSSDDNDTSIKEAFRKASLKKLAKQAAKRKEREKAKEARLAKVREREPVAAERPEPVVPEKTGAALQVQSQHFMQEKAAREKKIRELARIATRGETKEKPPAIEAEPAPITPDDPRVRNGTLAPSPKVAKHLEPEAVEERSKALGAARSGLAVEGEKPLQTSPFPEGYLEQLESGSPASILGGRKPSQLRGIEREAYYKALGRRMREANMKAGHYNQARTPSKNNRRTPLGHLIDEYRLPIGIKLRDLAELTDMTMWRVSRLVSSEQYPQAAEIEAIRVALDIPEEKLVLNGIVKPSNTPGQREPARKRQRLLPPLDPYFYTVLPGDLPYQIRIKELVEKTKWRIAWITKRAGIKKEVVRRILTRPGYLAGADKVAKIATAFGVTLADIDPSRIAIQAVEPTPASPPSEPPKGIAMPTVAELVEDATAEAVSASASVSAPAIPRPPIEKGIPIPAFAIRSDWYRWEEMGKGDSFLAECPAGIAWATFRDRFLKLADRMAEKHSHWYINETDDKAETVRIWRII